MSALPDYKGKRVVVTGGAGFIGSHLVDGLLASGAERVAVVDNFFLGKEENLACARRDGGERVTIYREDAAESTAMAAVVQKEKPDVVFNLATKALLYSFFNPAGACKVNLDIAIALGELLRSDAYGKLIHVSTSEVYGTAAYVPMDELHPQLAETSYAAGKAAADSLLVSYFNMFDLDITILRPFNNYGPRQNDGALAAIVPLTIRRIRDGLPPIIQGDGTQTRDFIYVADTVRGLLEFGKRRSNRGEIYNLASGIETSVRDIVDTLARLLDYKDGYEWQPARKADVQRHRADVAKAEALIGPIARTELGEGLTLTLDWYLSNKP